MKKTTSTQRGAEAAFEEKRRAVRRNSDAPIAFCIDHDQRWKPARLRDIAAPGMRLVTEQALAAGNRIVISAANPVAPIVYGVVRWSRPQETADGCEAGIEFDEAVADIDRRIRL